MNTLNNGVQKKITLAIFSFRWWALIPRLKGGNIKLPYSLLIHFEHK